MDALLPLILTASSLALSGISLERLVDSGVTAPPGIQGTFVIENLPPMPCGDRVLFNGFDTERSREIGLYATSTAGLEVIANRSTPVPGSNGTFAQASRQACVATGIVFAGDDDVPLNGARSAYLWSAGTIVPLLEAGTAIGSLILTSVNAVAGNGWLVAMEARMSGPSGPLDVLLLQELGGTPGVVLIDGQILPGQSQGVTIFGRPPAVLPNGVVFHARTFLNLGIYQWTTTRGFALIADNATAVPPPLTGTFRLFGIGPVVLDEGIVFSAVHAGGEDLFIARAGQIERLVGAGDITTDGETIELATLPSGAGSLLSFLGQTAESPFPVAFVRTGDGSIHRLVGVGDTLDGQTVRPQGHFGPLLFHGTDRRTVAVMVDFSDPPFRAIYRASFATATTPAQIPALSRLGMAVLVLALVAAGTWFLARP